MSAYALAAVWVVLFPAALIGLAIGMGNIGMTMPVLLLLVLLWVVPPIFILRRRRPPTQDKR